MRLSLLIPLNLQEFKNLHNLFLNFKYAHTSRFENNGALCTAVGAERPLDMVGDVGDVASRRFGPSSGTTGQIKVKSVWK